MSPEKMIHMANQIASFFDSKPHAEGVMGVSDHINAYWEPRMRQQFFALMQSQADDFRPLVREAASGVRPVPAGY
jgi:formate dehydrogenase subunit delta